MNKSIWLTVLLAAGLVGVCARYAYVQNEYDATAGGADAVVSGEAAVENIMTRASVRRFTDEAPLDSAVQTVLRAGMAAHSAGNKQPWRAVVVIDDEVRDSIAATSHNLKPVGEAPVAIAICGVPGETFQGEGDGYWVADCSAMAQNMTLAAHAMGLGSVWCAVYPRKERVERVRALLQLPDSVVPFAMIPLGYPSAAVTAKDKWNEDKVTYM